MAMQPTVLLVDDDENLLRGLTRALRQQPYQLLTTRSAEEAVWTLKTRRIDVVVADDRMPGMSGSDLVAWVAESYPEVIRIVLTGQATTQTAIRAINEGGVYYFFTKPCDIVQLALTIRKALEHKLLLDENLRLARLNHACQHLPEGLLAQLQRLDRLTAGLLDASPSPGVAHDTARGPSPLPQAVEIRAILADLLRQCHQALHDEPAAQSWPAPHPSPRNSQPLL
jgi:DNA-binding NtrC family response regulator